MVTFFGGVEMKHFISVFLILFLAVPVIAAVGPIAVWDFEDGLGSPVAADTSGVGIAADGTFPNGMAGIVADPLGVRGGGVLQVVTGDKMTTPAAAEPKFDVRNHSAISFWVHTPTWNDWWDFTIGKGGNGAPRAFIDSNPGTDSVANTPDDLQYLFTYATLERGAGAGGGLIDLAPGAWGNPWMREDGMWHHIGLQVRPMTVEGVPGYASQIYIDGALVGQQTTQELLEFDVAGILLQDALFEIGNNQNWDGYLDDVAVWDGWADDAVWADLAAGNVSVMDAEFIPEPATLALLGLGFALIRRRK
jgi:hypothetical protein